MNLPRLFCTSFVLLFTGHAACANEAATASSSASAVDQIIEPLLLAQGIPGMAVATLHQGKIAYYNYGYADRDKQLAVDQNTLFELGSVSKVFTATLGAQAQALGKLSLSERASEVMPALSGSAVGAATLLQLATYTAGGLPLQFPDEVSTQEHMLGYFKQWIPSVAVGAYRKYSNPSIGLFGYLVAKRMQQPFQALMEKQLFPSLGLASTFVQVPGSEMHRYAFGYAKNGDPVRVNPGMFDAQAYGVKSTAADMVKFLQANVEPSALKKPLPMAMATAQQGRYRVGNTVQALGWESYRYPVDAQTLVDGNSSAMALEAHKIEPLTDTSSAKNGLIFNKTGATNGFGAYLAFVPSKGLGVVLLANKNYPNAERVKAALAILTTLEK